MALFGAPLACEDHAVRACFAALRIREDVGRYAEERRGSGDAPVSIRIGLNSGEVVVRSISNDGHMDYTAIGQTTHLAARMEQMAEPGCALITGSTLWLAAYSIAVARWAPAGQGPELPVEVYELIGANPVRSSPAPPLSIVRAASLRATPSSRNCGTCSIRSSAGAGGS